MTYLESSGVQQNGNLVKKTTVKQLNNNNNNKWNIISTSKISILKRIVSTKNGATLGGNLVTLSGKASIYFTVHCVHTGSSGLYWMTYSICPLGPSSMSVAPLSPENPVNIVVPTGVSWKEHERETVCYHPYKFSHLKTMSSLNWGREVACSSQTCSPKNK